MAHQCLLRLPQYMRDSFSPSCTVAPLFIPRSCTAAAIYMAALATIHEPQYMRDKRVSRVQRHLVYCGATACRGRQNLTCRRATIGAFFTIPKKSLISQSLLTRPLFCLPSYQLCQLQSNGNFLRMS